MAISSPMTSRSRSDFGGRTSIREHVEQDVEQFRHAVRLRSRVEAGVLLVRKRVEVSADALNGLELGRIASGGALEEQVFDEVRDAVSLRGRDVRPPRSTGPRATRCFGGEGCW